jgi:hypothetical protein
MSEDYFRYKIICVENDGFDICGWVLIILSYMLVVITFPIAAFFCVNVSLGIFLN